MRLLVTSDLHFDHGRSRLTAEALVAEVNTLRFDVLMVVGDVATSKGTTLEDSLRLFTHAGPRLLTLGNHELWGAPLAQTSASGLIAPTVDLYLRTLPSRVGSAGFHLLDQAPYIYDSRHAFVGSVGWYDYAFAPEDLGIPRRFYEAKITPGSASYYTAFNHLLSPGDDIPPETLDIYARWNDPRYVDWGMSDEQVCTYLLNRLKSHLDSVASHPRLIAAIHHLPLAELLPPRTHPRATHAWDFAKAYLGSPRFGELLSHYPNLSHVFSGHSHFPACARPPQSQTKYLTTGSGYREKHYYLVEV